MKIYEYMIFDRTEDLFNNHLNDLYKQGWNPAGKVKIKKSKTSVYYRMILPLKKRIKL